ncbi:hypothetical protein AB0F49_07000 [Micromonospora ureilytica]|uniref:hypothetical protein n=1 Tax=Micromonospora ureilytica TaxID=709868 RepID=UPI0033EFE415
MCCSPVPPGQVDAYAIAEQVHRLLPRHGNAEQRDAARAVAEEIAAMPSPAAVAQLLPEYALNSSTQG